MEKRHYLIHVSSKSGNCFEFQVSDFRCISDISRNISYSLSQTLPEMWSVTTGEGAQVQRSGTPQLHVLLPFIQRTPKLVLLPNMHWKTFSPC